MAFSTREVAYVATVSGFDKAEQAIEGADKAIDRAGDGAERAAGQMAQAEAAAIGLGEGTAKAGEESTKATGGVKAFEERVGSLNKLLTGFGLLSLPGAIKGIYDLGKGLYDLTDAGRAATIAEEAHKAALDATLAVIIASSDATRIATKDLVSHYRAKLDATRIEKEIAPILEERIELEGKLKAAQDQYNAALVSGNRISQESAQRYIRLHTDAIAEQDAKLDALTASYKSARDAIDDTTSSMQDLGHPLALVTEAWGKAADAVHAEADRIKADAEAMAQAVRESLTRALDLSEAIDLDSLPQIDVDAILGGPQGEIRIGEFAAAFDEIIDTSEDAVEASRRAWGALADQRAAFHAAAAERAEEAQREAEAQAQAAEAWASSTAAAIGAAASLGEAFGAGAAVVAAIRIAQEIAEAASEGAAAASAFAVGNVPGAIAHGAAAAEHVAAAVKWGSDAIGGGGGGASAPAPPTAPAARETVEAGNRERGKSTGDTYHFEFGGQPMHTITELQDGIGRALDELGRRRGGTRVDYGRSQRRS